ncbi:MAG: hypothetical protein RMJ60_10295, partial [Anaerolineales bacterium]|nr:hypothetical protein [Anaerolineales bacterium]
TVAQQRYLHRILEARPISAGEGMLEVHMLLNHRRLLEGLWSLYSFAYFSGQGCHIIVHDDGSLERNDALKLHKVFPGSTLIPRHEADLRIVTYFREKGLTRCIQLRDSLVFACKLFDPIFFAQRAFLILLDSDVLFFRCPDQLLSGLTNVSDSEFQNFYSVDNGYRYCIGREELLALMGRRVNERLNPGILRVKADVLSWQRIEEYLKHPGFWNADGTGNYYAEMTLWAMELTLADALPLSPHYAICPYELTRDLVAGHYCGGGYWASYYYTFGLPYLARVFLNH